MSFIQTIAGWLEPARTEEKLAAEAGVKSAKARLREVKELEPTVKNLVRAHQMDRNRNHYGERILNALKGGF